MGAALEELVSDQIRRNGSIRYDDLMELALYHPDHGFYAGTGQAGRADGDFITSPEVGPLFGALVARAIDQWWRELGEPDPFVVVEAAAGRGALAVAVLRASPACLPALRYVLVERSAALRERQRAHLDLEEPANAWGPAGEEEGDGRMPALEGRGPVVVSVPELPGISCTGVVLANELLDNLPVRLLERDEAGWREVRVGLDGDRLVEMTVAAHPTLGAAAEAWAPGARVGARVPVQRAAVAWVREARGMLRRGRVVAIDYADTTRSMADRPWREWLRTYRAHQPGGHPLEALGEQDVTCEVAVDQLASVQRPDADRSQADFLRSLGIDELVDEGRRRWEAAAAAPDLAAVEGRSRAREAEALTDPGGLGAHRVVEWAVR